MIKHILAFGCCMGIAACGQPPKSTSAAGQALREPAVSPAPQVAPEVAALQTKPETPAVPDTSFIFRPATQNDAVAMADVSSVLQLDLTHTKLEDFSFLSRFAALQVLELPSEGPANDRQSQTFEAFLQANEAKESNSLIVLFNPFATYVPQAVTQPYKRTRFIENTSVCELYRQVAYQDGAITFNELNTLRWTSTYPLYDFTKTPRGKRFDIFLLCDKQVL